MSAAIMSNGDNISPGCETDLDDSAHENAGDNIDRAVFAGSPVEANARQMPPSSTKSSSNPRSRSKPRFAACTVIPQSYDLLGFFSQAT